MKKYLIALCLLFSCGCGKEDLREKHNSSLRTVEIEGCEYLEFDKGALDNRVFSLTHKGNCKNKIHKYATEAE